MANIHKINYRIYYEDTDSGGVVYNANYLKFAERARTEYLRESSIEQSDLLKERNIAFMVRKVEMELFKPARLDNLIEIQTNLIEQYGASIILQQNIFFDKIKLSAIKVQLIVVNTNLKPIRLPRDLKQIFNKIC